MRAKVKPEVCWCVCRNGEPLIGSCRWTRKHALQVFLDSGQRLGENFSVQRVEVRAAPSTRPKRKPVRGAR